MKHLYLIGYGINFSADRSALVDQYIAKSETLYAVESDIQHIERSLRGKTVINLISLYQQGLSRSDAYIEISKKVLAAFGNYAHVGLLVEGSPFFLDSICEMISIRAKPLGISVTYIDGRSSLDVIIQTLRMPLDHGLGVFLADNFCAEDGSLDVEAINIFFQPGNVGSERVQMHCVPQNGVRTLQERLLTYYPPSQRWFLINLGQSPNVSTKIVWNTLSDLVSFHSYMHSGTLVLSKNWWPSELLGRPPTELN